MVYSFYFSLHDALLPAKKKQKTKAKNPPKNPKKPKQNKATQKQQKKEPNHNLPSKTNQKKNHKEKKPQERGIKVTEKKPSKASSFLFQTTGSVMTSPFNTVELISIGVPNFCYLKPFLPLIKLIAVPVPATNITSY